MATYGPDNATLTVHTGRGGAAAKAGHDLTIAVERWSATLDEASLTLDADAASLRVLDGSGGISALGDDDKAGITQTIDEEVLKGTAIAYRSSAVERHGDYVHVDGELSLAGVTRPLAFTLDTSDGLAGSAQIKQTDWRIKPFSALFGTLKVADVVEVRVRSDNDG